MRIVHGAAAALILSAAACASSATTNRDVPPATPSTSPAQTPATPGRDTMPTPFNPLGNYEYTTDYNGQPVNGSITIGGTMNHYTGIMRTGMTPDIQFRSVDVHGNRLTLTGPNPAGDGGDIVVNLIVDGRDLSGNYTAGSVSGTVRGRKTSSP